VKSPAIKGVILAAGYGSRFLPVTKTIPKEMLPLVDTPCIKFIVDEFAAAGIREILIITSRRKKVLEDYFDREIELESTFAREDAQAKSGLISVPPLRFYFVRQTEMKGTAHALMLIESFAAGSPFVVAYPDDLLVGPVPHSQELVEAWRRSISPERPEGCAVLSVIDLAGQNVARYGVIDPERRDGLTFVRRMVEKPPAGTEPSHLVSLGRYLYTRELFPVLHELAGRPRRGEFYQTEPINVLAAQGKVIAVTFRGTYLDTGEPLGYAKAFVRYALSRPDLRDDFARFLAEVCRISQKS